MSTINNAENSQMIPTDMRDAMFESLYLLAEKDKDVILLVGDQGAKSFEKFQANIPAQFINAGPAEQNIISVAAGLALSGKKVFAHAIACFITARCYEQIKIDIGLMNLPVTIIGIGGGYAYESDGPTHHSNQDLALMRGIPGMTIFSAADPVSATRFPAMACTCGGPSYIRFDKGVFPFLYDPDIYTDFRQGMHVLISGKDLMIIATGVMTHKAMDIARELRKQGIEAGVIDLYRIKPLNKILLTQRLFGIKNIVTMEEHQKQGGVGSIVSDFLSDQKLNANLLRLGIEDCDCFHYGDRDYIHFKSGLDMLAVINKIINWRT